LQVTVDEDAMPTDELSGKRSERGLALGQYDVAIRRSDNSNTRAGPSLETYA